MGSQPVADRHVIDIEGNKIEFYLDNANEWAVRHNDVERGKAKKLKNVELTVILPDGTRVTPQFVPSSFLAYKYNPTCAAYWDGRSWNQYCW